MPRLEGKNNSGTRWALGIVAVVVLATVIYFGLIRQMANTELIDTSDTNIVRPVPPMEQGPAIEPQIDPNAANTANGSATNSVSPIGTPAAGTTSETPGPGSPAPPGEGSVVNPDGTVTSPVPAPEGNASSPPPGPDASLPGPGTPAPGTAAPGTPVPGTEGSAGGIVPSAAGQSGY